MRALLLSEIFPPTHGGSGRWFWELYSRLDKQSYLIAAGESAGAGDFDRSHDLPLIRYNLSSTDWGIASITGLSYYWRTFRVLRRLIKSHDIKSIHCGRCLPEGVIGYLLSRWYRIPLLCFIHGEDIETASMSRELSLLVKMVLNHSTALVCNSENTAQLMVRNWGTQAEKINVLHPGVDSAKFVPADSNDAEKSQLGWAGRRVLLTVGRLQERKGHDRLIQALPKIVATLPDVLYVVIGDGEEKPRLQSLVTELNLTNHVRFLSEVSDEIMLKCYQQCTLFILPNRTIGKDIEGFGMVLVEAQSCGKPVVAGESGGTRETMLHGQSGYIIDCTDPDNISDKLIPLLSDQQKLINMGIQGRQHTVEKLDWKSHTAQAKILFSRITDQ